MQQNQTILTDEFWLEETEDMPESGAQGNLAFYLRKVLEYLYRQEDWFVPTNFLINGGPGRMPTPDLCVFKGYTNRQASQEQPKSWRVTPQTPAPSVVFEFSSDSTWTVDLGTKLEVYRQLGVREYFAYDPNTPRNWRNEPRRLRGWTYRNNRVEELTATEQGRLWSEELGSYLGEDGPLLRLYDRAGSQRLSKEEAEEAARQQAEIARQQAEIARQQASQELEQARQREEALKALLRQLNPDIDL